MQLAKQLPKGSFSVGNFLLPFQVLIILSAPTQRANATLYYKSFPDYRYFPMHLEATNLDLVM